MVYPIMSLALFGHAPSLISPPGMAEVEALPSRQVMMVLHSTPSEREFHFSVSNSVYSEKPKFPLSSSSLKALVFVGSS